MGLSLPLPVGGYQKLPESVYEKIDWKKQVLDQPHGYMVCCTLEVPEHLHEALESFPPAPEKMDIAYKDLSPYAKEALKTFSKYPEEYKAQKLVGTLGVKEEYFCHYMNLKLYLELGLTIKKVHSVTQFNQERIFQPYINKTMELRREAKSKFKSNIWKKMNNACYVW